MLTGLIAVACGGAIGSMCRYLTVTYIQQSVGTHFPHGTLLVNSIGSFFAGFLMILIMERVTGNDYWRLFLMVGFLGGYTTFSSFSWETWSLYQEGKIFAALFNILLNNAGSLTFAFLGILLGRWVNRVI